jgi:hypothetical protein
MKKSVSGGNSPIAGYRLSIKAFTAQISTLVFVISLFILESVKSTKLIMTVTGGPYDCLAEGTGENMVLYGDRWDRGYKYNAKTNKDLNKYEGGHNDKFIEGKISPLKEVCWIFLLLTLDRHCRAQEVWSSHYCWNRWWGSVLEPPLEFYYGEVPKCWWKGNQVDWSHFD